MTLKELKNSIEFREERREDGSINITGKLLLYASTRFDERIITQYPDVREEMRNKVTGVILDKLYGDRRPKLHAAIEELLRAPHGDYKAILAARDKIMDAAEYQPPYAGE